MKDAKVHISMIFSFSVCNHTFFSNLNVFLFVVGYLLIAGGYYSDKSFSTYGIRETEVVDVLSDISEGCGIRAPYPDGIHPFETGGDMVGENAVVCGGYCRNEDCGNGE